MNNVRTKLSNDLKIAMGKKDIVAIKAIRSLMARIDNAGAIVVPEQNPMQTAGGIAGASSDRRRTEIPRKELSEKDIQELIQGEIRETETALKILQDHSRPDTEHLADQINILKRYLS